MSTTDFINDINKGKIGELIFKEDFLEFLNINFINVTGCQQFQVIDSDYLTKIGIYEIKTNYKDDEFLIFEDFTNINEELGKKSCGWIYKSKADLIVFISKNTKTMIFLPMTDKFKKYYELIKNNFELIWNRISIKDNQRWQSAFRKVPFNKLNGYISEYKKRNNELLLF